MDDPELSRREKLCFLLVIITMLGFIILLVFLVGLLDEAR